MPLVHPALLESTSPLRDLVPPFLLDDRERVAPLHLLSSLARRLAAAPGLWRPLVRHDPARRWYTRLVLSGTVEVWLIGWSPGQFTPVHDHGGALGALAVAEGWLEETLYSLAWSPRESRTHGPGSAAGFSPYHVHLVGNATDRVTTSVHAYSPPGLPMRLAPASAALTTESEAAPVLAAAEVAA